MPELQKLLTVLLNQKGVHPNLTSKNGTLYQNRKILLNRDSPLKAIIIANITAPQLRVMEESTKLTTKFAPTLFGKALKMI